LYVGSDDRGIWAFGAAPDLEATVDETDDAGSTDGGASLADMASGDR
ncbi:MAG: hypothetical protein IT379_09365, partial [Deltaproteobacteria bacterium]|nr:hypothetical protein [Deltaproteobacteria bacterium]